MMYPLIAFVPLFLDGTLFRHRMIHFQFDALVANVNFIAIQEILLIVSVNIGGFVLGFMGIKVGASVFSSLFDL